MWRSLAPINSVLYWKPFDHCKHDSTINPFFFPKIGVAAIKGLTRLGLQNGIPTKINDGYSTGHTRQPGRIWHARCLGLLQVLLAQARRVAQHRTPNKKRRKKKVRLVFTGK